MRRVIVTVLYGWCLITVTQVRAQDLICVNETAIDPNDELRYVRARFPDIQFKAPTRWPYLGGRNQTYCCIQAVDTYLSNNCTNAGQVHIDRRILDPDVQFPCGASWVGDSKGAPEVEAEYSWTSQHCSGWQLSAGSSVREWAQLLVSFILPSVVFSFNIPRPRKLKLGEGIFHVHDSRWSLLRRAIGILLAAGSVTLDTIIWLMVSFAFAGPLLLSGLYEAQLDKRVLNHLRKQIKENRLPLALRARILFSILCGNLDMNPAWRHTMDLAKDLDAIDKASLRSRTSQPPTIKASKTTTPEATASIQDAVFSAYDRYRSDAQDHREALISGSDHGSGPSRYMRISDDQNKKPHLTVTAYEGRTSTGSASESGSAHAPVTQAVAPETENTRLLDYSNDDTAERLPRPQEAITETMARLKAMLSCQYSFGTTIAGPVIFFIGSFIYALLEIRQDLGNEDVAEALAFGMWWTIVPHIAAVAGLLLAGNNPNILAGIVSAHNARYEVGKDLFHQQTESLSDDLRRTRTSLPMIKEMEKPYVRFMQRVYEAEYMPAWMWDRGRCKQDWLLILFTDSWLKYKDVAQADIRDGLTIFLTEVVMLSLADWIWLWLFAFFLMITPCVFSFSTAYFTPEIGIGCRAMTFLIYVAAQTLLLILWAYYLTRRDSYWATAQEVKRILQQPSELQSPVELSKLIDKLKDQTLRDTGTSLGYGTSPDLLVEMDKAHPMVRASFYILCAFGFIVSLLASIGGTLMQLIGVYRANFCLMSAGNWLPFKSAKTFVTLSTNTADAIHEAKKHWIVIGSFSVALLGLVCYAGWWYQKRRRAIFKQVAGHLNGYRRDSFYIM